MDTCKCGRLISWRLKGMCLACRYKEAQKKPVPKVGPKVLAPKEKICEICGKPYTGRTSSKTCSEECRKKKARMVARAWDASHRGSKREVYCVVCGKIIHHIKGPQITCSPECRREYQLRKMRQYSRARHGEGYREKACLVCGKLFKPTGPRKIYCSEACIVANRRSKYTPKLVVEKICAGCGKSFMPAHPRSRYCSDECRGKTQRELQHKYNQAFRARQKAKRQKSEESPMPNVIPKREAPKPKPVIPQMVVQKRELRPIYRKPAPVFQGPAPKAILKVNTAKLPKPYLRYVKASEMRMDPPDDYKEAREGSFAAIAAKEDMMRPIGTGKPIVYTPEEIQIIKEMYLAGETCTSIAARLGKGQPGGIKAKIDKMIAEGELPA